MPYQWPGPFAPGGGGGSQPKISVSLIELIRPYVPSSAVHIVGPDGDDPPPDGLLPVDPVLPDCAPPLPALTVAVSPSLVPSPLPSAPAGPMLAITAASAIARIEKRSLR